MGSNERLTDDELRLALAREVALHIFENSNRVVWVTDLRCPDCRAYLIEFATQRVPHCWFCTTDAKTAIEGRKQLSRAMLAEAGLRANPKAIRPYEETGRFWPEGMPL